MLNKMKDKKIFNVIVFLIVLLIPLIYSFFYLKSYWNPYGDLSSMKIAVVNLDTGADGNNQGDEFVKSLKESGTFNICQVIETEAEEGMKKGEYYATIQIPEDFTKSINSASEVEKKTAKIIYRPNQATNYLATQIINSAVKTIELNLQSKIDKEIIASLSEKLNEVPESLENISDGANTILEGTESLNDGISQIDNGVSKLKNSYTEFDNGINTAYTGSVSLNDGINQVLNGTNTLTTGSKDLDNAISKINSGVEGLSLKGTEGIINLYDGILKLNFGAKNLNEKMQTYVGATTSFSSSVDGYVKNVAMLSNSINECTSLVIENNNATNDILKNVISSANKADETNSKEILDNIVSDAQKLLDAGNSEKVNTYIKAINENSKKIVSNNEKITATASTLIASDSAIKQGTKELYTGTEELKTKSADMSKITDGIDTIKISLKSVKDGTSTLNAGITSLKNGVDTLSVGSNTLTNGLKTLSASSSSITEALDTLNSGTKTAYDGSNKLVSGVLTFKEAIETGLNETKEQLKSLDGIEEFGEKPVEFITEEYGKVDSYGVAFTPLFLCIGLWVGSLMCYVVLYYDHDNRFGMLGINSKNKILQNFVYLLIGAIEGIITALLLKAGLGFEIDNMFVYLISSMLIGITFMSIIQFLIRNFGDIGKFLALIILVLQLAAAGGTFPIETIDKGFQVITPYLPMTYSIKLLREILVPTASNFKGNYMLILTLISIFAIVVTFIVDKIKLNNKNLEK